MASKDDALAEFLDGRSDAYAVLGIEGGASATEADIKKAYRRKALELHPDKNRDDPDRAAADFSRAQRAFQVLSDAKARRALDDLVRARTLREERHAGRDEERRRMVADLEAREREARGEAAAAASAAATFEAELDRLREEATKAAMDAAAAAAAPPSGTDATQGRRRRRRRGEHESLEAYERRVLAKLRSAARA